MWCSPYHDSTAKRLFDLVVLVLVFLPALFLMAVLAAAIFVANGRPVLFVQPRAGRDGRVFHMPKFRTMEAISGGGGARVTLVGRFLRRYRLDEIPQLLLLFSGVMSFVGPRPELTDIASGYSPFQKKRLAVKPGITGLWQVMGSRRMRIHEDVGYDLYYVRKARLALDIKIAVMTVLFILCPRPDQV